MVIAPQLQSQKIYRNLLIPCRLSTRLVTLAGTNSGGDRAKPDGHLSLRRAAIGALQFRPLTIC
jgi:hypothetical protein